MKQKRYSGQPELLLKIHREFKDKNYFIKIAGTLLRGKNNRLHLRIIQKNSGKHV